MSRKLEDDQEHGGADDPAGFGQTEGGWIAPSLSEHSRWYVSTSRNRRVIAWTVVVALLSVAVVRGFFEIAPPRDPFRLLMDYTRDHGSVPAPDSSRSVRVVIEEVGAQRSGNPYMWVSNHSLVRGYQVVAEGFIAAEDYDRSRRTPLRWVANDEIEISLATGKRRGSELILLRCKVP